MRLVKKLHQKFNQWLDTPMSPLERYLHFVVMEDESGETRLGLLYASFLAFSFIMGSMMQGLGLLLIILLHEWGHAAAMRLYGLSGVKTLTLPFIGGMATADDPDRLTPLQSWCVAAAGPLTGVVLMGFTVLIVWTEADVIIDYWLHELFRPREVYLWFDTSFPIQAIIEHLVALTVAACLINALNLLPINPLDGGKMVSTIFHGQSLAVRIAVIGIGAVIGISVLVFYELWITGSLMLVMSGLSISATIGDPEEGSRMMHPLMAILAGAAHLLMFTVLTMPLWYL